MNQDDMFEVSIKGTHFSIDIRVEDEHELEVLGHIMSHKMGGWYRMRQAILNQISQPRKSGMHSLLDALFSGRKKPSRAEVYEMFKPTGDDEEIQH